MRFPETIQKEIETIAKVAFAKEDFERRLKHEAEVEQRLERLRIDNEAKALLQEEIDADQTPALDMITLADYMSNPNTTGPSDLIEGMLKDNGLCIILGPSGSGKSTFALQTVHSLMTGDDFLGQPVQKINGGVGILSYDMDGAMTMDWVAGFPGIDPVKISVVNAYKRGNPIGVTAMRQKIASTWSRMNVEYVVVDSFSASFFGKDQNDAASTMAHYRDLIKFALTECGARALSVIVHSTPGSPNAARGSSVHHDVADSIVSLMEDDNGARLVSMVKYRAARGQRQMSPVAIGAPDPQTHLVAIDTGAMALSGMALPPSAIAMAFPDANEEPDLTEEPDLGVEDL